MMPLMKFAGMFFALVLVTQSAFASGESHLAAVDQLFTAMKMKQQYETSLISGFNAGLAMSDQKLLDLPLEQQNKINAGMEKVRARVLELMGWNAVKSEIAGIYTKNFTEEEVVAITKMLETPTGQMLVSKQISLLPETMAIGQKKAQEMMPEIARIMQESLQ